jgi:hypothetical protein
MVGSRLNIISNDFKVYYYLNLANNNINNSNKNKKLNKESNEISAKKQKETLQTV